MEQLEVQNTTEDEVQVMWDGQQIYFKPGQKKAFTEGVARGIANEAKGLELVGEKEVSEPVEVAESPAEAIVEDNFTETVTKKGSVQYRKNGKMISKADYETR